MFLCSIITLQEFICHLRQKAYGVTIELSCFVCEKGAYAAVHGTRLCSWFEGHMVIQTLNINPKHRAWFIHQQLRNLIPTQHARRSHSMLCAALDMVKIAGAKTGALMVAVAAAAAGQDINRHQAVEFAVVSKHSEPCLDELLPAESSAISQRTPIAPTNPPDPPLRHYLALTATQTTAHCLNQVGFLARSRCIWLSLQSTSCWHDIHTDSCIG